MTAPSAELRALRHRLRKVATGLDVRRDPARDDVPSNSGHLLDEAEQLLQSAGKLTALVRPPGASGPGDELDDVLGRVALRDVSHAAARLRQILIQVAADLARIDSEARLPQRVNDAEEELLQDLIDVVEWEARLKGGR